MLYAAAFLVCVAASSAAGAVAGFAYVAGRLFFEMSAAIPAADGYDDSRSALRRCGECEQPAHAGELEDHGWRCRHCCDCASPEPSTARASEKATLGKSSLRLVPEKDLRTLQAACLECNCRTPIGDLLSGKGVCTPCRTDPEEGSPSQEG